MVCFCLDDRQDNETKQDDSKGRKTNKQSHVDVDVTITNKNKSTKASTKEASSTKGNINKPEPAKDSPRKVRTKSKKNTEKSENTCMNIDMSINDDVCIILYTCTKDVVLVHYFLQ
jgi:hypothetical protein